MSTKFGRQPVYAEMYRRFTNPRAVARDLNDSRITESSLYMACAGHVPPSDAIRERLPKYMGMDLSEMFTEDALAARHIGKRGPRPGWKKALTEDGAA